MMKNKINYTKYVKMVLEFPKRLFYRAIGTHFSQVFFVFKVEIKNISMTNAH